MITFIKVHNNYWPFCSLSSCVLQSAKVQELSSSYLLNKAKSIDSQIQKSIAGHFAFANNSETETASSEWNCATWFEASTFLSV